MFQKKSFREDQNIRFMFRSGKRQMIIWRMRIACGYLRLQTHSQNM